MRCSGELHNEKPQAIAEPAVLCSLPASAAAVSLRAFITAMAAGLLRLFVRVADGLAFVGGVVPLGGVPAGVAHRIAFWRHEALTVTADEVLPAC